MGVSGPRLRERAQVIEALDAALAVARGGRGSALFVIGAPGLGKTSVLGAARDRAASADMGIRRATGSALEADLALAFAEQLAGPLGVATGLTGEPHRVDVDPGSGEGHGDLALRRARVHELARAGMERLANRGPVAVLLDDLHWADPDSLSVVGFLARRLISLPVALVVTLRPWPDAAARLSHSLHGEGAARILALQPLSRESSAGLFCEQLGHAGQAPPADPGLVEWAWNVAKGNPLLIGAAARSAAPAAGSGLGQPGPTGLVLRILDGLPPEALECARAAAVLGQRFRPELVEAILDQDPATFAGALDLLMTAGVLRGAGAGGWISFDHDLVATAIRADLGPGRRRLLHARAFAQRLEAGDVTGAASHALAGGLTGDDRAVDALAESARLALAAGAVETGLDQLAAAVELARPAPPPRLLLARADALYAAGRPEAAVAAYQRVLDHPPGRQLGGDERIAVHVRAARARIWAGRLREARADYDALLADGGLPMPVLITTVLERAHAVWELDGPAAALAALYPPPGVPETLEWSRALDQPRWFFRLETGDASVLPALGADPSAGPSAGHATRP
ncbi:MAG: ATP-binding protein, partial [Acidimicrobiales bacterium]